jgi:hypothetical protein
MHMYNQTHGDQRSTIGLQPPFCSLSCVAVGHTPRLLPDRRLGTQWGYKPARLMVINGFSGAHAATTESLISSILIDWRRVNMCFKDLLLCVV